MMSAKAHTLLIRFVVDSLYNLLYNKQPVQQIEILCQLHNK